MVCRIQSPPIFAKADIRGVMDNFMELLPLIVVLTFIDMFDTMGTLMGLGAQAGLLKKNKLPRAAHAFAADAAGTVFGAVCGHSSVTSYIESGAGVEAGGRTGLTAVTVAICFFAGFIFLSFSCGNSPVFTNYSTGSGHSRVINVAQCGQYRVGRLQ